MRLKINKGIIDEADDRACSKCDQRADNHVWKCTDCGQVFDGELKPAGEPQCVCGSTMVGAHCRGVGADYRSTLFFPRDL
jgi:ribosomal protein L37AE/L43A